jgi:hypothetical protein
MISRAGELQLDRVRYTTCPPGSNDWELQADDIDIDSDAGVGTARDIKLRFQGIPILWAPFISFPVSEARKSGILTPEIGSSGRSGNELRVPYYWNIAPNYDATITPRLLTERGLQLQTEFRYLTEIHDGELVAQYLPDDQQVDDSRHMLLARHRTLFDNDWRGLLRYTEVSDNQYFEDLGGSLSASSITHLDRHLSFDWHSESMDVFAQVQDFQTLDDAIPPGEEPYRRVPQLVFEGWWPDRIAGVQASVDAEVVNFERDVGVGPGGVYLLLGSGDPAYERFLTTVSARYDNFVFLRGYSDELSQALYGAGDLFLMPSSFEPCGISQMLAMRAGQPCLVHHVGGLKDTVRDGVNGFAFTGANLEEQVERLKAACGAALAVRRNEPKRWAAIRDAAANARFSWQDSIDQYLDCLYQG